MSLAQKVPSISLPCELHIFFPGKKKIIFIVRKIHSKTEMEGSGAEDLEKLNHQICCPNMASCYAGERFGPYSTCLS